MDAKVKRVLIKISGEALCGTGNVLDDGALDNATVQIASLAQMGVQVGVVVGGGNIWRGRSAGKMNRTTADHMGMLATAINCLGLQAAFERAGVPSVMMSAIDMPQICDLYTHRGAMAALEERKVALFACGTGRPFFSTDTAAALRAAEIGADVLLLAKNVDYIYDKDPKVFPDAKRFERLDYDDVVKMNLRAVDLTAITLCKEVNMPIICFGFGDAENIRRAARGEAVGTRIGPRTN